MLRPLTLSLALTLAACSPPPPPPQQAAPAPRPTVEPAPSAVPAASSSAVAAAPKPAPCHPLLKGLPFGKTIDDRDDAVKALIKQDGTPLTALVPSVREAGYLIESATAIEIDRDPTARALVLNRPLEEGMSSFSPRPTLLGVITCTEDRGYVLAAEPRHLDDTSTVLVWATERLSLPNQGKATVLTLAIGGVALEFHAAAFVVGAARPPFSVASPKNAPVGVIATFGNVAQQFLIPESRGESYARADRVEGTGFYPLSGKQAFVSLQLTEGAVRGIIQGEIDAAGARPRGHRSHDTTFAAIGKGELPPFCDRAEGKLRCSKLALPAGKEGLSHGWIAGLFASVAEAEATLKGLGQDPARLEFLAIDADDDGHPPPGPGGKKAKTVLVVKAPGAKPHKGKR